MLVKNTISSHKIGWKREHRYGLLEVAGNDGSYEKSNSKKKIASEKRISKKSKISKFEATVEQGKKTVLTDLQKALSAAKIKSNFAHTIFKVESTGDEIELKKIQRQKEREAARIALENMERTVEWNDALQVTQEFEKLIGCVH